MAASLSPLFTWRSAIASSDLSPTTTLVAYGLSLHMNERGGSAWPALTTIAQETRLGLSTVRRAVRDLESRGWLRVRMGAGAGGTRGRTNVYEATVPGATENPPAAGEIPGAPATETRPLTTENPPAAGAESVKRASVQVSVVAIAPTETPPAPSLRDRVKNALAEAWQGSTSLTPDAWRRIERPASEILAFGVGDRTDVTPEDLPEGIAEFAELWRVLFPHSPCTPQSVAQRWAWFVAGAMHAAAAERAADDERRARWRRRMEAIGR